MLICGMGGWGVMRCDVSERVRDKRGRERVSEGGIEWVMEGGRESERKEGRKEGRKGGREGGREG